VALSGLGMRVPVALDTRTLAPASVYLMATFTPFLRTHGRPRRRVHAVHRPPPHALAFSLRGGVDQRHPGHVHGALHRNDAARLPLRRPHRLAHQLQPLHNDAVGAALHLLHFARLARIPTRHNLHQVTANLPGGGGAGRWAPAPPSTQRKPPLLFV
jgi:hypothetical protein